MAPPKRNKGKLTKSGRKSVRDLNMKAGHTLREADSIVSGVNRGRLGMSPQKPGGQSMKNLRKNRGKK